ncbi:MAG: GWxTD domain-containing protein [Candidatus Aminicenantes bacterium]
MIARSDRHRGIRGGAVGLLAALLAGIAGTAGCSAGLMPTRDAWYTQHYYLMQRYEQETYKKLSDAAKPQFQALFWEARSPEAKKLFDSRMEFILKTFAKENSNQPWNTDRARVYLLNGSPANIDYKQNTGWAMQTGGGGGTGAAAVERSGEDVNAMTSEVWTFPSKDHIIEYTFSFVRPNEWRLQIRPDQNRYLGEFELDNRQKVFGPLNPDEYRAKLEALLQVK